MYSSLDVANHTGCIWIQWESNNVLSRRFSSSNALNSLLYYIHVTRVPQNTYYVHTQHHQWNTCCTADMSHPYTAVSNWCWFLSSLVQACQVSRIARECHAFTHLLTLSRTHIQISRQTATLNKYWQWSITNAQTTVTVYYNRCLIWIIVWQHMNYSLTAWHACLLKLM